MTFRVVAAVAIHAAATITMIDDAGRGNPSCFFGLNLLMSRQKADIRYD